MNPVSACWHIDGVTCPNCNPGGVFTQPVYPAYPANWWYDQITGTKIVLTDPQQDERVKALEEKLQLVLEDLAFTRKLLLVLALVEKNGAGGGS